MLSYYKTGDKNDPVQSGRITDFRVFVVQLHVTLFFTYIGIFVWCKIRAHCVCEIQPGIVSFH